MANGKKKNNFLFIILIVVAFYFILGKGVFQGAVVPEQNYNYVLYGYQFKCYSDVNNNLFYLTGTDTYNPNSGIYSSYVSKSVSPSGSQIFINANGNYPRYTDRVSCTITNISLNNYDYVTLRLSGSVFAEDQYDAGVSMSSVFSVNEYSIISNPYKTSMTKQITDITIKKISDNNFVIYDSLNNNQIFSTTNDITFSTSISSAGGATRLVTQTVTANILGIETTGHLQDTVNFLTMTLQEKMAYIQSLNSTLEQKAAIIEQMQLSQQQQGQLIQSLNLTISQQVVLIQNLTVTQQQQATIISGMQLNIEEQATLISSLTQQADEQAAIINSLTTNLATKAALISQLTAENENQAELIRQMNLSFSNQAVIIDALNLTIAQDADLINQLTTNNLEQAAIISHLNIQAAEMALLITNLTNNVNEQLAIISALQETNQQKDAIIQELQNSLNYQINLTNYYMSLNNTIYVNHTIYKNNTIYVPVTNDNPTDNTNMIYIVLGFLALIWFLRG